MAYFRRYGNFKFTMFLSNFWGAKIVEVEDDTTKEMQEGIFIPLKENGLEIDKYNNVKVNTYVIEHSDHIKENYNYGSHWVYQHIKDEKVRDYIRNELGRIRPTIFGNLYPYYSNTNKRKG